MLGLAIILGIGILIAWATDVDITDDDGNDIW